MNNDCGVVYSLSGNMLLRRVITTTFRGSGGNRGAICKFSARSGSRMRRYLRSCDAEYVVLLTLTYPGEYPASGRTCKDHLREFVRRVKRQVREVEPKFSAFWVLEFQERGAAHFHLLLTHRLDRRWIANTWYEVVGSGDERHLQAGTRIEAIRGGRRGMSAYFSKYASKMEQKIVPESFQNVGRFWGVIGNRSCRSENILFAGENFDCDERKQLDRAMNETIMGFQQPVSIRRYGEMTVVVFLRDEYQVRSIRDVMHRTGLVALAHGKGAVEHPLMETGVERYPVE